MRQMPYPTTMILLALIGSVTVLGWQGTIDGAAVTSIFGGIVSGVLVGHYVKTSNNVPQTTTKVEEGGKVETTVTTHPRHTPTTEVDTL